MSQPFDNIRVVLTAPLYGGNIGSVCRAMANMGISDLVIADPQPFDEAEARQMACAAIPIFHNRREMPTLRDAVADCVMVAGTSAREGLYRSHCRTARETAPRVLQAASQGTAALVFGRETSGLSNAELALCTDIIRIPTADQVTSLNLAQAVMVCLYELFVAADVFESPAETSPPAPSDLRERMLDIWEAALFAMGFMEPEKAMHMMLGVRRIFSRRPLTVNDVRILMGIGRQMQWCASHPSSSADPPSDSPADSPPPNPTEP